MIFLIWSWFSSIILKKFFKKHPKLILPNIRKSLKFPIQASSLLFLQISLFWLQKYPFNSASLFFKAFRLSQICLENMF